MMKVFLQILKCGLVMAALHGGFLHAQMVQYGHVVEMNSGKKALANVSVSIPSAHDCQPTASDVNGTFRLSFGEHRVGDVVYGLKVKKHGYEVVNHHVVREGYTLTDRDTLRVVMAPEGMIAKARARYYDLLETACLSRYDTTMSFLREQYAHNKVSEPQWNYWKSLAEEELKQSYLDMETLADRLARVNGDELDIDSYPLYEKLLSGEVEPALALVSEKEDLNVLDTYVAFVGNYPMEDPEVNVAGGFYDLVDIPDSLYRDVVTLDNYSQHYEADFNSNGVNYSKCCCYLGQLFLNVGDKVMAASCYRKALKMYELLNEMGTGGYHGQINELKSQLESLE